MARQPRVMFGDDGSPSSDIAWLFINNQPWPGWRVEIVTAHFPGFGPPLPPEQVELHPWDPPRPRRVFAEAGFAEVAHLTAEGDPRVVLSRGDCDLLVIGRRGPGVLKALGSTSEWLLHRPTPPLLIARHGHAVHQVTLCVDGSPHAQRATDVVAGLPWARQLNVAIVAVDDGMTDVAAATLAAATQLQAAGAAVQECIRMGDPTPVILEHLELRRPDLVAFGCRGLARHRLRHRNLGPTASAIARTASGSLLVTYVPDDPSPVGDDQ